MHHVATVHEDPGISGEGHLLASGRQQGFEPKIAIPRMLQSLGFRLHVDKYLNTKRMSNNSPKLRIIAIKAIILHTFGVQEMPTLAPEPTNHAYIGVLELYKVLAPSTPTVGL